MTARDQFDRFVIGHSPVLARPIAGDPKLRVDAAFPVQVQDMLRRFIGLGHNNVFQHRLIDAPVTGGMEEAVTGPAAMTAT